MLSDAFKPTSVKDDDGNEVEGLIQIQSQKVNKVRLFFVFSFDERVCDTIFGHIFAE